MLGIVDRMIFQGRDDPTDKALANALRCSTATARRAVKELVDKGFLSRRRRHARRVLAPAYTLAGSGRGRSPRPGGKPCTYSSSVSASDVHL